MSEKLCSEQKRYTEKLVLLQPVEILEHAYEYWVRESIVSKSNCIDLADSISEYPQNNYRCGK